MKQATHPKWQLFTNSLPILILLILFKSQYNIIQSLLSEFEKSLWFSFGTALVIIGLVSFFFSIYLILINKRFTLIPSLFTLFIYITFLFIYFNFAEDFIPFSVPNWMINDSLLLYVGTFLMPTLMHSLFIIILHFTPEDKTYTNWFNFVSAFTIPLLFYIFFQVILPFWNFPSSDFSQHLGVIIIIVMILVFLFFLIRGILILSMKKSKFWSENDLLWKIPITIILPIIGLIVNKGTNMIPENVFGNFNHFWFFVLALMNGILLSIPDFKSHKLRLLHFFFKSLTFSFTLYFFIVFLPFLPFSIFIIIIIGLGFLMLTPLVLMLIHSYALSKDYQFLRQFYHKQIVQLVFIGGLILIPSVIFINFRLQKQTLLNALNHLEYSDFNVETKLNSNRLTHVLAELENHKEQRNFNFGSTNTPYLSSLYNWLVLDNLTLSNTKINKLKTVFLDAPKIGTGEIPNTNINDRTLISFAEAKSTYDVNQDTWITWVDLQIENTSENNFAEFSTKIHIPDGCWIGDYYLYVGDKKEFGLLTEKKAALWIYTQIRNENRDPGLLYYLNKNEVVLKVFPLSAKETRKTGIQFIHKEPLNLQINPFKLQMGNVDEQVNTPNFEDENLVYLSTHFKKSLDKTNRKPYLHFIVDCSKNAPDFSNLIREFSKNKEPLIENAKVSFVNYNTEETSFRDWESTYLSTNKKGGFFADRAIKKALSEQIIQPKHQYPIFILLTNEWFNGVFDQDYSNFTSGVPEINHFYYLKSKDSIHAISFNNTSLVIPIVNQDTIFQNEKVLVYQTKELKKVYLPDNNEPSIIFKKPHQNTHKSEFPVQKWESGLKAYSFWFTQIIHPNSKNEDWLNGVKMSFENHILNPYTSFIVVENEAQKAALLQKQKKILSGNKNFGTDDEMERMSEPRIEIFMLILGLIWILKNYIKKSKTIR